MRKLIPAGALRILRRLEQDGYEAYLVGGCVRDLLRGAVPQDWDICTCARPEQVQACFTRACVTPTGIQHGTVTVVEEDIPYEITTFRADGSYTDGRRPDRVCFVSRLEDDLARRDFTMNAIAMDALGAVHDPFGGRTDIAAGRIRCVGAPAVRFEEDGLRVLRALRFAAVLDFEIETETAKCIRRCRERLSCVSAERICAELKKLLLGRAAGKILRLYGDVFSVFWPEVGGLFYFTDRWGAAAAAIEHAEADLAVRLALLLHPVDRGSGGETAQQLLLRLRFDRESVRQVKQLTALYDTPLEPEDGTIRRWLNRLGPPGLRQLLVLQRSAAMAEDTAQSRARQERLAAVERRMEECLRQGQCFTRRALAVDGRDILAAGAIPGPMVGETLNTLLEQVLDGRLPNRRDVLLAELKSIFTLRNDDSEKQEG